MIQLVDANTGDSVKTLLGHTPDGKQLISGTNTGTVQSILDTKSNKAVKQRNEDPIRIWDIETGALVKELVGHTGSVTSLRLYEGGRYLVSGSQDHTIRVWDVYQGRSIGVLSGHNALIDSIAVTPDGRYFVSAGTETVKIWESDKSLTSFFAEETHHLLIGHLRVTDYTPLNGLRGERRLNHVEA